MGLPSKQRTRTSKKQRASHFALKASSMRRCDHCKSPIVPHHACQSCGTYRGKKAVNMKKRVERSLKNKPRNRAKQEA